MQISQKEQYILKRKRKKITLSEIAEHLRCSVSLLSKYEANESDMNRVKIERYRSFIDGEQQ